MSQKPNPGLLSQADYARRRKVDRSYINRLAKRGILVMRGRFVDVAASDAVLDDKPIDVERQEPTQAVPVRSTAETALGGQPSSFAQARTVEMVYRARARKLDFEAKSGKLIFADEVKVAWFQVVRQVRDKLLAMPTKLAPQLAALTEVREVRELLDAEIAAALRGLQEDIRYGRR